MPAININKDNFQSGVMSIPALVVMKDGRIVNRTMRAKPGRVIPGIL